VRHPPVKRLEVKSRKIFQSRQFHLMLQILCRIVYYIYQLHMKNALACTSGLYSATRLLAEDETLRPATVIKQRVCRLIRLCRVRFELAYSSGR
jgi:hypothetical protein